MAVPNLARDPFVNHRPVRRLAALLWVAALGLMALNGWLYGRHFANRGEQRSELAQLAAQTADEGARLQDALATLEGFDLTWQGEQVAFLNAKIAERTFAWSALFDDLAEVLPLTVRVERLTPQRSTRRAARRAPLRSPGDEVELEITGAAEKDEALLELVDGFFAHERFSRPNLRVESRNDRAGQVSFSMSVVYRPAGRLVEAADEAPPAPPLDAGAVADEPEAEALRETAPEVQS